MDAAVQVIQPTEKSEIAMSNRFDVTNVVTMFHRGDIKERPALIKAIREGCEKNRAVAMLISNIADEASKRGLQPIDYMMLAFEYGAAIGVLIERERTERKLVM